MKDYLKKHLTPFIQHALNKGRGFSCGLGRGDFEPDKTIESSLDEYCKSLSVDRLVVWEFETESWLINHSTVRVLFKLDNSEGKNGS